MKGTNLMKLLHIIFLIAISLIRAYAATEVYIIQHSRNYIEAAQRDGLDVKKALERDISSAQKLYLVIARKNDCWINQATSALQRTMVIQAAVDVLTNASRYPTYEPVERWIAGIKQRVLRESGGLDIPRSHYLAPSNAAVESSENNLQLPRGTAMNINAELQPTPTVPEEDKHRLTSWPEVFLKTFLFISVVVLVTYAFIRMKRYRLQKQIVLRDNINNLRSRVATKERGFYSKFPELQGLLHVNTIALVFTFMVSQICFGQRLIEALDVSITYQPMHAYVKSQMAMSLMNGKSFDMILFGDSVRNLGTVKTLSTLDSIFVNLPRDRNTRLSEAISWLITYTDSLRQRGSKTSVNFHSDFWNDDNNNEAVNSGLIGLSNEVGFNKADSLHDAIGVSDNHRASVNDGIIIGGLGSLIMCSFCWFFLSKQRKQRMQNYNQLVVSTCGIDKMFLIESLRNKKLKIGPEIDSDMRTFGVNELVVEADEVNGTLSMNLHSPKQINEDIAITLRKDKNNGK